MSLIEDRLTQRLADFVHHRLRFRVQLRCHQADRHADHDQAQVIDVSQRHPAGPRVNQLGFPGDKAADQAAAWSRGLLSSEGKTLAGAAGIEPANHGIKTRCLTTWLRPNPARREHIGSYALYATFACRYMKTKASRSPLSGAGSTDRTTGTAKSVAPVPGADV